MSEISNVPSHEQKPPTCVNCQYRSVGFITSWKVVCALNQVSGWLPSWYREARLLDGNPVDLVERILHWMSPSSIACDFYSPPSSMPIVAWDNLDTTSLPHDILDILRSAGYTHTSQLDDITMMDFTNIPNLGRSQSQKVAQALLDLWSKNPYLCDFLKPRRTSKKKLQQ